MVTTVTAPVIPNVDAATVAAIITAYREAEATARAEAKAAREEARALRAALTEEVSGYLTSAVETLLTFTDPDDMAREGSPWVGASLTGVPLTIGGVRYAVTLSAKDIVATDARKV